MTRIALLAAALAAAVLAVTATAGAAGHPKLYGTVGKNGAEAGMVKTRGGISLRHSGARQRASPESITTQ